MTICEKNPEVREQLRTLGFLRQERHIAMKQVVNMQRRLQLTREACVDLMYDPVRPMTSRQIRGIRDRFGYIPERRPGRLRPPRV